MKQNKKFILYTFLAYCFSIGVGFFWVYQFWGYEPFIWNNQFMINTNDGYYWAEGARDIIAGFHQNGDHSPINSAPSLLTAFLYKIFPFSFETIIFYMSRFLASLIVIPIMLIAKDLKQLEIGFITALFSSIAWSYYNRTMVGYYDTDMLNVVLPIFLLWSIIGAFITKKNYYLLLTAFTILIYQIWYPQSYALEFSFWIFIAIFTLYKKIKKQEITYELALLIIMLLAMLQLHWEWKIVFVTLFYIGFITKKILSYLQSLFIVTIILFLLTGGLNPIWSKIKSYVIRDNLNTIHDQLNLHFFSVMQTVREAGKIPFETFANRISGHISIFFIAIVGYGWLLWRYRVMIFSLPLVGLGFLAYVGGLRFTIYAIVPLAFGLAFFIIELAKYIKNSFFQKGFIVIATILILLPNLYHAWIYRVPTVFEKKEVAVLNKLKQKASREDYVVSWWDYGYPIRYYSDVKTLIDGGKHSGADNYLVSYMLTHSQEEAAKLARFDVEYTQKQYQENKKEYNKSIVAQITLDQNFTDVNDFLLSLDDIQPPKKTRDIYFYLPNRMLNIFPTVAQFSNIDVMTGKKIRKSFFYISRRIQQKGNTLFAFVGKIPFIIDFSQAKLLINSAKLPIKKFIITYYDYSGKLHTQSQILDFKGYVNIIYMKNYNQILFLNDNMLHSSYIQMFVLEHYNKELFEPVILTPLAKVYKLKE